MSIVSEGPQKLRNQPRGYNYSEEGAKAYADADVIYELSLQDIFFQEYFANTHTEGLPPGLKPLTYRQFIRVKPYINEGEGSERAALEYCFWVETYNRIDKASNTQTEQRLCGIFPKPQIFWGVRDISVTQKERYAVAFNGDEECYSKSWNEETKKWIKGLQKEGLFHPKISFGCYEGNSFTQPIARRIHTINTLKDFLEGEFESLCRYGKIPPSDEKERAELDKKLDAIMAANVARGIY